ncbi:MAG: ribosome assembly RNA-binding protein YhbY [Clostridia bacterium]|nr:ribosome assembly RNA-binding protein YhbY [Clostridia bacterium]
MKLTGKQRAKLRSMANTMQPIFIIGKDGLSPMITSELDLALEARELIKVNVLETCEQSAAEIADMVAGRVHAEVIQVIGRKFVLYRESHTKKRIEI